MTETSFVVRGPFEIPTVKPPGGGRRIEKEQAEEFWLALTEDDADIEESRGCFIFAMRNGPGSTPGYVGKTVQKTFRDEAFHVAKRDIYNKILSDYQRGTPTLFFVLTKNGRGVAEHIDLLETYLIQNAAAANPDLENVQRSGLGWNIAGVFRSHGGPPNKSARALRDLLGLAQEVST